MDYFLAVPKKMKGVGIMLETDEEARYRWMKRVCLSSTLIIILSVICIVVGGLAVAESAPTYTFPYCLGGAMIAGIMSIISSCCNLYVYREYRGMTSEDVKNWIYWMSVVISFMVISLMLGVGISGIWGMTQTSDRINTEQRPDRDSYDLDYEISNRNYAIASFVLVLGLSVLHIVAWCQCLKFLDTYDFSGNSYRYTHRHSFHSQQRLPQTPYAARENRSREVLFSIPIPEIYYGTTQQETASIRPSESPSIHRVGRPPMEDGANIPIERPQTELHIPPPSYEQLEEGGLPSYKEVVIEGRYISTGNTELVTKI